MICVLLSVFFYGILIVMIVSKVLIFKIAYNSLKIKISKIKMRGEHR